MRTIMPELIDLIEQPPLFEAAQVHCAEIYVPKKLAYLSPLYEFLKQKTMERLGNIILDGFSIYEVDGVFYSPVNLYEDRTLVVRILFRWQPDLGPEIMDQRIRVLGRQIADKVAAAEQELWITRYWQ